MTPKKRTLDISTNNKAKKQKLDIVEKKSSKHSSLPAKISLPNSSDTVVARTNEVDFPRGGGSNFTPLERKILHNEAVKEAEDELFKVC